MGPGGQGGAYGGPGMMYGFDKKERHHDKGIGLGTAIGIGIGTLLLSLGGGFYAGRLGRGKIKK